MDVDRISGLFEDGTRQNKSKKEWWEEKTDP